VSHASVQIAAGSTIGPYVVERKLAQGGMSVLFLAHDTKLDRSVALKMMAEEVATPATRARLLREARTLAAVDHAGIVRIYGAGEHEGTPWIAMELIRGTDLKRLLAERGPVPPMRALRWIIQATEALAAAHDVGVIHRDLKPSNLLLTHDDQIKIVDFGIAKRRMDSSGGSGDILTSQGEVLGTPAYLSPEQLEHGLADERSDVWGLGCVLYELCVGSPPFGRSSSASTTAAILRDEPPYPPHMSGAIGDVISACLRKNSFARVGSMRELGALARDALDQPGGPTAASSITPDKTERGSRFPSSRASTIPPSYPPTGSFHPSPLTDTARQKPSSISRNLRTSAPPGYSSSSIRAASAAPRGRMKGTAVRTGIMWFAQTYGTAAIARMYEAASPELKAMIRLDDPAFGIVASAWYDTLRVGEMLILMESLADAEDVEGYANALASAIAKDNVTGVYRSLFRLITTPTMLEANAQRVWRTYCDEGTLTATSPREGELHFEIKSWVRHHGQTCKIVGFAIQHVLRQVGYEGLVIERSQCISLGDPLCAFEGIYLAR
jgi:serine/threonine-protein kinase